MKNHRSITKIINYIDTILVYTTEVNYERFVDNTRLVDACVFNLSQIGELVTKLDEEYIN